MRTEICWNKLTEWVILIALVDSMPGREGCGTLAGTSSTFWGSGYPSYLLHKPLHNKFRLVPLLNVYVLHFGIVDFCVVHFILGIWVKNEIYWCLILCTLTCYQEVFSLHKFTVVRSHNYLLAFFITASILRSNWVI